MKLRRKNKRERERKKEKTTLIWLNSSCLTSKLSPSQDKLLKLFLSNDDSIPTPYYFKLLFLIIGKKKVKKKSNTAVIRRRANAQMNKAPARWDKIKR